MPDDGLNPYNPSSLPPVNYKKMITHSKKDRHSGSTSGGYSAGANHPPSAKKGKLRVRSR